LADILSCRESGSSRATDRLFTTRRGGGDLDGHSTRSDIAAYLQVAKNAADLLMGWTARVVVDSLEAFGELD
jgi:hypothetical protein